MSQSSLDQSFRSLFLLIWKNRMLIIIAGFLSAAIAAGVSYVLPQYFVSTVTIFPTRVHSIIFQEGVRRGNLSDFGEEEEAEQTLQIIESDKLIDQVTADNDLFAHYKIDPKGVHARSMLFEEYRSNVSARRTKYNSIVIKVKDKSPEKAAEIANSINAQIDAVKNDMIQNRANTFVQAVRSQIAEVDQKIDTILSKMKILEAQGVVSEYERAALFQAYGDAVAGSNSRAQKSILELIEINKKLGTRFDLLKRERDQRVDYLNKLRVQEEQYLADASLNIAQKFDLDAAKVPDKKSYPIRWLVVLVGGALGGLGSLLYLIFQHYRKTFASE